MFQLENKYYLYALGLVPLFILIYLLVNIWRKRALKKFGDISVIQHLFPDVSKSKRFWKFILFIVAFTFLKLVNSLGIDYTFWTYALICVAGLIWGYFYIPETKGKSLEEIEMHWRNGDSPKDI